MAGVPPKGGPGPGCERDTVPLGMLAMPDEGEQMTPPEVGDEVSYSVTGKVVSVAGDNAVIERKTINGKDVGGGHEGQEPNEGDLMAEAQEMDGGMAR